MNWTATIIRHNDDGLTMDVSYAREGYSPITVGVLLPTPGTDLQGHLEAFAPYGTWDWIDQTRLVREKPEVGTVVHGPRPAPTTPAPAPAHPKVFEL